MTHYVLTADQEKAALAFTNFLLSDDVEMVISGGAGVGKSTLLAELMDQFVQHNKLLNILGAKGLDRIIVAATTNKAAAVLSEMTDDIVPTIHSLLGLMIKNDYKTGETTLTCKEHNQTAIANALIIVDECSMIDRHLYGWIHKRTNNCKFLFIGDHCQMAPVKEAISPVFTRDLSVFKLNEIIRSKNAPPITELCQQLRQTVETNVFGDIEAAEGYIEYLNDNSMKDKLNQYFVENDGLARVLCFTNQQVNNYNGLIRRMRNLPPYWVEGEVLVSNQATIMPGKGQPRLRIEEEVKIVEIDHEQFDMEGVACYKLVTNRGVITIPVDQVECTNLMKHYARNKNWHSYFTLKDFIADLRPRDASTVYKAQGSTYDTVFVDLGNIGMCNVPGQTARMLYVACSRPQNKIYFYGHLPTKYRNADYGQLLETDG